MELFEKEGEPGMKLNVGDKVRVRATLPKLCGSTGEVLQVEDGRILVSIRGHHVFFAPYTLEKICSKSKPCHEEYYPQCYLIKSPICDNLCIMDITGGLYISLKWATGIMEVTEGIISGGAPIFKKWHGKRALDFINWYKPDIKLMKGEGA